MSKIVDLSAICDRAQGVAEGTVSPAEVELAREVLRKGSGDIASALYIVGFCGNSSDAELVENYMHGADRHVHGELALKALCRYLGLIERYRSLVRELILSDRDLGWSGSRMAPIHLADVYLAKFQDNEVGCRLLNIFCDFANASQPAARSVLVKILNLRQALSDPFGLDSEEWNADADVILSAAKKRFECKDDPRRRKKLLH
ncbi:hypothetical protein [Sinorhizobium saheli]|uniref:Uncharacterized protein n=1 Tax=Sinorhizobium saheli TaxID=36856 RepID=A0A178YF75_SINSA|nr:hypothetical protein [Sinorhizobium saheli]MQW90085.1 hypothetical protein [Sinorhizobium saheli]OAP45936.1 hypothetical protein ATB98_04585 [Sinorhizobium saheli]